MYFKRIAICVQATCIYYTFSMDKYAHGSGGRQPKTYPVTDQVCIV